MAVDSKDTPAWLDKVIRRFEQDAVPKLRRDAAAFGVTYIVSNVIPETEPYPPVDTGAFRAGFREQDGDITHVNPKMYAIIDKGVPKENVKVSRKMIDALTFWVTRKFGIGDQTEARHLAIKIAQGIKRRGLPPKRIRERAAPAIRAHLVAEILKWWEDRNNWTP